MSDTRLNILNEDASLLANNKVGIERECLRIDKNTGSISQEAHPASLGNILTHNAITVDFGESQLEFITNAYTKKTQVLTELENLYTWTQQNLDKQLLWNSSSPCYIKNSDAINIANFGNSNIAQIKNIYRSGLALRYSKIMQCVSGIHYNFSLSQQFFNALQLATKKPIKQLKTNVYLTLARNVKRSYLMLLPLTGASPVVDASFVQAREHSLKKLTNDSYYLPYATSLRMSDIGYQSNLQNNLKISFNEVNCSVASTLDAILKSQYKYSDIALNDSQGSFVQLNQNHLQLENEHYSIVRIKPEVLKEQLALKSLLLNGVHYTELRCLDINPFVNIGIASKQYLLYEIFMVSNAINSCSSLTAKEIDSIASNHNKVVYNGLNPKLEITVNNNGKYCRVNFFDWIKSELEGKMLKAAELLDSANNTSDYTEVLQFYLKMLAGEQDFLAQKVIAKVNEEGSFNQWAFKQSQQFNTAALATSLDSQIAKNLENQALKSRQDFLAIEAMPKITSKQYIYELYKKYEDVYNYLSKADCF